MRIGAGLSTDLDPATATAHAVEKARSGLGDAEVSLAVLVTSRHHAPSAEAASEVLRLEAGPERVIGCVAETVVGGDREVEDGPAVAVWLASLPEPVETFHMEFVRTSEVGVLGGHRFGERPSSCLLIGALLVPHRPPARAPERTVPRNGRDGRDGERRDPSRRDAPVPGRSRGGLRLACAGEIGPVGGKNFLHGFTASIALLTEA